MATDLPSTCRLSHAAEFRPPRLEKFHKDPSAWRNSHGSYTDAMLFRTLTVTLQSAKLTCNTHCKRQWSSSEKTQASAVSNSTEFQLKDCTMTNHRHCGSRSTNVWHKSGGLFLDYWFELIMPIFFLSNFAVGVSKSLRHTCSKHSILGSATEISRRRAGQSFSPSRVWPARFRPSS